MFEIMVDRAQAEIDTGFRRKALWSNSERVESGEYQRFGFGVARQYAPLLNQGARQGLYENPLRQQYLVRLTAARIAGLIPSHERHDYLGAGPGVVREVVRSLRRARFGARVWQGERIVWRPKKRSWWFAG